MVLDRRALVGRQIVDGVDRTDLDGPVPGKPLPQFFRNQMLEAARHLQLRLQPFRTFYLRHLKLMLEALFLHLERRGQGEDFLAMLKSHHPTGGKASAITDAVHFILNVRVRITGTQKYPCMEWASRFS